MDSRATRHFRRCGRCGARYPEAVATAGCPRCLLEFGIDGFPEEARTAEPSEAPAAGGGEALDFGGYVLEKEIGRGGMGIVYRARQKRLNRLVAIKLILFGRWASEEQRRRFRTEAAAAAALDHPNIVPIYEFGEQEGQPFYVMKLVAGDPLAQSAAKPDAEAIRRRARIVSVVARAVHYAHQRRVLHRDLKPTNILVDADGEPHLTDFGLAKMLEGESTLTRSGALMGSPHYMAPEQVDGRTEDLTTAIDVHALGVVLYELITGSVPFSGNTPLAVLDQVRGTEPERPSTRNPTVDRDLESICLKCLRKEPDRRYGSAQSLAEDLENWLSGLPIAARPVGTTERVGRWIRRRPLTAALMAFVVVLVIGIATVSSVMAIRLARARDQARRLGDENRRRVVELNRSAAIDLVEEGEHLLALPWFDEALKQSTDPRLNRNMTMLRAAALDESPRLEGTWTHDVPAPQVRFSPDGAMIAIALGDGRVLVVDASSGRESSLGATGSTNGVSADKANGHSGPTSLEFSPDGKLLVSAQGPNVVVRRMPKGEPAFPPLVHADRVLHLAFHPASEVLATACADNAVRFWNMKTGEPVGSPVRHLWGAIRYVVFHPNGGRLATFGEDSDIRLWSWPDGTLDRRFYAHQGGLMGGFLEGGRMLLGIGDNNSFLVQGIDEANAPGFMRGQVDVSTFSAIRPDGRSFAIGCRDGRLSTWPVPPVEAGFQIQAHHDAITYMAYDRSGQWLATAGLSGNVRVWWPEQGLAATPSLPHGSPVTCLAFDPKGPRLVTACQDGTVRLWSLPTNSLPALTGDILFERLIALDPSSERALHVGGSVWDMTRHAMLGKVDDHRRNIQMAFVPGRPELVVLKPGGELEIDNYERDTAGPSPWAVTAAALMPRFSGDGRRVVVIDWSARARVFDVEGGDVGAGPVHLGFLPSCAAMNEDGTRALFGDKDGRAVLWDIDRSAPTDVTSVAGGSCAIVGLVSGNGEWAFACDNEGVCRVWKPSDTDPTVLKLMHPRPVLEAVINLSGTRLATRSADGYAYLWSLPDGARIGSPLTHGRLTMMNSLGSRIVRARFDRGGDRLRTTDRYFRNRLWDAVSGHPLTPPPGYASWRTTRVEDANLSAKPDSGSFR